MSPDVGDAGSWPADLDHAECLTALTSRRVGRVAVTDRALPAIVPVNYTVTRHGVVFRTSPGGMLARACAGHVVAFEVDDIADDGRSGWSVLVVGVATLLDGSAALRAVATGLTSAVSGGAQFILVPFGTVTGRVVTAGAAAVPAGGATTPAATASPAADTPREPAPVRVHQTPH